MIFWAATVIGLMGSPHCVGMCGGLVAATSRTPWAVAWYQIGRLVSYSLFGFLGGYLGQVLSVNAQSPWIALLPSLALGVAFIMMGLTSLPGWRLTIQPPAFFSRLSHQLLGRALKLESSFFVGAFSFLLPCGFLYGALLVSMGFHNPWISMGVMAFFWLGTVPAVSFAPELLRRLLKPLQQKSPRLTASFFIFLGVATLAWRIYHFTPGGVACH